MTRNEVLAGVDIGGTKCAVSIARDAGPDAPPHIVDRVRFDTPGSPQETLEELADALVQLTRQHGIGPVAAVGVACGGPLDSGRGLVLSPPNLPGWDHVDVITPLTDATGVPVALENDANAGALAEWLWGAGRGVDHLVFLTFGTGLGAGLILNGRLYRGANCFAGEVGHMRVAEDGPVGFGKAGSFEGFCSGGGIARLAREYAQRDLDRGRAPAYCPSADRFHQITARGIAEAAHAGDSTAREVYEASAAMLGKGLAAIIDALNPQKILIGGVYARQTILFEPAMRAVLRKEAIPAALGACSVEPAGLGEQVGDYAALAVARSTLAHARQDAD